MHYFTLLLGVAAVATIITAVPVVKERERLAVILDGRIANAGQALHECHHWCGLAELACAGNQHPMPLFRSAGQLPQLFDLDGIQFEIRLPSCAQAMTSELKQLARVIRDMFGEPAGRAARACPVDLRSWLV